MSLLSLLRFLRDSHFKCSRMPVMFSVSKLKFPVKNPAARFWTFSSTFWRPTPEGSQTEPLYSRPGRTSPLYAATEEWDLTMITFVKHIRKLTIKFRSLFNFWSCDTSSSSSFKGRNTLIVFFLTIDVPIEVSRICINVADQAIYIQIVLLLLPNIILNSSSQSFKGLIWVSYCPFFFFVFFFFFFCFSMSFFLLRIFLLISEVIHGTEETVRLVLDGMCWSAKSWIKEVIKLKFSCTARVSG